MNMRRIAAGIVAILLVVLAWLLTTNHPTVWPVRNTLQYRLYSLVGANAPRPATGAAGTLQGTVRNPQGEPVGGAWVLVARRDGITYTGHSSANGNYSIGNIPPGTYKPVASAPGYGNVQFGGLFFNRVRIRAGATTIANVNLPVKPARTVTPGQNLQLGEPVNLTCNRPLESQATRRQIHFTNNGDRPNQLSFYYRPVTATTTSRLPVLLAVYPGPADGWECASLPLAQAGYAVLAIGPAYSFDLEADIDELERLLMFARNGQFPGSDGRRIALLGGSYSGLHVQRLLQRGEDVDAALLLGPPTDLFDMRRRLENGSYIPPFDLDKALIALGFPDQVPLRYWRYSGAYHVRADFPPLMVMHSRSDEVVPYQQSELFVGNLEKVGANYQVHFFDGASHYLLAEEGDEDALKIYQITLDFLAEHLQ